MAAVRRRRRGVCIRRSSACPTTPLSSVRHRDMIGRSFVVRNPSLSRRRPSPHPCPPLIVTRRGSKSVEKGTRTRTVASPSSPLLLAPSSSSLSPSPHLPLVIVRRHSREHVEATVQCTLCMLWVVAPLRPHPPLTLVIPSPSSSPPPRLTLHPWHRFGSLPSAK